MARLFDDGSNEYLGIGSTPVTAVPLSMAGWFNVDDDSDLQCILSVHDASDTDMLIMLILSTSNTVCAYTRDAGNLECAETSTTWSTGSWFHACGVWSAVDARAAFLNGGGKGTESTSIEPSGLDAMSISKTAYAAGHGNAEHVSGLLAELGLWSAALSDAEVEILALGYSPLFIRPQSLVAYWPLIRDEDQDRVGGYDMTAFNTPSVGAHVPKALYPAPVFSVGFAVGAPPGDAMPMAIYDYRRRRV